MVGQLIFHSKTLSNNKLIYNHYFSESGKSTEEISPESRMAMCNWIGCIRSCISFGYGHAGARCLGNGFCQCW